MANTAFGSQKPEKIAPVLEEMLRKEIGAPMPIAYQIMNAETRSVSAQSLLSDYGRMIVGGNETPLFLLQFTLAMPRPAELQVRVNRQGIGAHVGLLSYAARLVKPIGSEVSLEPPKTFGASKCIGDPQGIARLNNNGDLLKRLNKLARTESEVGGLKWDARRAFGAGLSMAGAGSVGSSHPLSGGRTRKAEMHMDNSRCGGIFIAAIIGAILGFYLGSPY